MQNENENENKHKKWDEIKRLEFKFRSHRCPSMFIYTPSERERREREWTGEKISNANTAFE